MTIALALLRGINVGGKNVLPMALLRTLAEGLGLEGVRTYIQSGNMVFRADARALRGAGKKLEDAIEGELGFRPLVVVRTLEALRDTAARNPFARRKGVEGSRLLVMFLGEAPSAAAAKAVGRIEAAPDEVVLDGMEAYLHLPNGVAEATLSMAALEKALGVAGTCRNWNTVQKLLAMGEELEGA